jgi:hypothetical protein
MRTLIAGVFAGVVIFLWGFIAHVVLPIGEMGMKLAPDGVQDQLAATMKSGFEGAGEGIYFVPGMDPMKMDDEAAKKAYGARATSMPYAMIVYQPEGKDIVNNMGPNLGIQFATDLGLGLLAAFVASLITGFGRRVQAVTAMGVFAFGAASMPYWNWYRFPLAFTEGALIESVVAALLAGVVSAWWLGRGER